MNPNLNFRLCTCLTEKTIGECANVLEKIQTELVEHRLDYLEEEELKKAKLGELYSGEKKIIATCRRKECGGKFSGTEEERVSVLVEAVESGAEFVDIEVETEKGLKKKLFSVAKEKRCKMIVSVHDFEKTPSENELLKMMEQEIIYGADIGKIVAMANSPEDCHRLLGLMLKAKEKDFEMVAFGMGEKGKFSRPLSLIYGSPFTFVCFNKASAPGQFTLEEMQKIMEVIE